jgi:hypothetical protein
MVCEVLLHRIEESLVGSSCELRPAFAVRDPTTLFDWRGALFLKRPAECR